MQMRVLRHVPSATAAPTVTRAGNGPAAAAASAQEQCQRQLSWPCCWSQNSSTACPWRASNTCWHVMACWCRVGFHGYLMTDGYEGYNTVARVDGVEHMVCWAHVRRRLVEAARVQPKGKRGKADETVGLIGQLYGIERAQRDTNDAASAGTLITSARPLLSVLRPPSSLLQRSCAPPRCAAASCRWPRLAGAAPAGRSLP